MTELFNIPGTKPYVCINSIDQVHTYKGNNPELKSTIVWKNKDHLHSRCEIEEVVAFLNSKYEKEKHKEQE